MKRKCSECGRPFTRWPIVVYHPLRLLWLIVVPAVLFFGYAGITTWIQYERDQKTYTQSLIDDMPPCWQTMYYVLGKVSTLEREVVIVEFMERSPGFFEGERMTAEQWGLLMGLFPVESTPEVLSHISENQIAD